MAGSGSSISTMNKKLKIATVLTMSFISGIAASGSKPMSAPDFAFPKKVSEQSLSSLKKSVAAHDSQGIVRSILDYGLAQSAIGQEKMPNAFQVIDNTLDQVDEPVTKSLLYLVKAKMLCEIYSNDKYNFNSRELPLLPLPKDYNEWPGKQFQHVISQLCDSALSHQKSLQDTKLSQYYNIVRHDELTPVYFPSLYDFVAYQTIDIRSELTDFSNMFTLALLSPTHIFIIEPHFVPMSSEATKILDTYSNLLKFHASQPAPYIFADMNRLDFVNDGLYHSVDTYDADKQFVSSLQTLYDDNADNEYSGNILIELLDRTDNNMELSKWIYDKTNKNISSFPTFNRIDCLKNILKSLSKPSVETACQSLIYPGKEFKLQVTNHNCTEFTVTMYRLPSKFNNNYNYDGPLSQLEVIDKKTVRCNDMVPFVNRQELSFTAPEPGYYITVITSDEISKKQKSSYPIINCTRLTGGSITFSNSGIFIVDAMKGSPESKVSLMKLNNSKTLNKLGLTDDNGFFTYNEKNYSYLYPQKGEDIYAKSISVWKENETPFGVDSAVAVLTELPLYHPGDTVKFVAIAYDIAGRLQKVMLDATITACLFDANNQLLDSLTLKTDNFGRADGQFKLPANGLTGSFNIAVNFGKHKLKNFWGNKAGSVSFMVSDYKLPTFEITADRPLNDTPYKGDVTLHGSVKTYSGMPLGNQEVILSLSVAQNYWWRMSNKVIFFTDTVNTDENGNWKIILSKAVLDNSPAPNGFFNATVSSTSSSGETQQTDISFTRGNKYIINASIPSDLNVDMPVTLNVKVTNSADEPANIPVLYHLAVEDTIVQKGIVTPDMDWKHLSGNEYTLKLWLEADTDCCYKQPIILYSPADKVSPTKRPMWMPAENNSVTTDSDRCRLLYAVNEDDTYLLVVVSTPEKILEQKWVKATQGMHYLDIDLPHDVNQVKVDVQSIRNMQSSVYNCTITKKSSLRSLDIKAETFRNKMIPGTTETWTFRTSNINNKGEQAAVILNLYNSAINALTSPTWQLNLRTGHVRTLQMNTDHFYGSFSQELSAPTPQVTCSHLFAPQFNLYSRRFVSSYSDMLFEAVRPTASNIVMRSAAAAVETEDAIMEKTCTYKIATPFDDDAGANAPEKPTVPEFSYRESNVVCGLWMPSLTSDENGNLSVSFAVPNANTTWQLFATAFDKNLTNSTLSELIVANKPVMVQPNLPRYLRTGDKAVLKSLVMNNTDSVAEILTTIEIFNPVTNQILSTHQQAVSVQPQQNATVSINVTAPMDDAMIGFRVKSSANGFADGEQSIIPILPASQPVIESTTFYIAPDSTACTVKLPQMPADARVTLQYCDNPLWYVVTALPGLAEQEPKSAINAAYNIFSAAVAQGILKDNPSIAKALKYWTSGDSSDSTLVSMLEKNADLKTMLLNATPWLADAKSDTERMTRLALLLDKKNIDAVINSGIKYLQKVQRGNGFAWMTQCDEPSLWATSEVVACLGRANQLHYMPDNKLLKGMIDNALNYIQAQNVKAYSKYPKADYSSYVAVLDLWPSFKRNATSQKITSITVQSIVKNWRKYSVGSKAEAVIMLMNHNYKSVAGTILASLREYSEYKPQSGMWWPSVGDTYGGSLAQLQTTADALEAFHAAEPSSKDVDRIRQWLILQKEAENWGSSAFTTDVISSILHTSKSWIQPAGSVDIKLNEKSVLLPDADKYTGYFRTLLTNASNANLTVSRQGTTPAFGAVFCQFTQDMAHIPAQSSDAVSIEKRYYKYQGTEVVDPDSIKIGDKIQVALTIHVNRDMQYVAITDNRPACFEPVEQLPKPLYSDGLCFYRENRDSATNLFVTNMPKGTYQLRYDMWVNNAGEFASGIATLQSQYAPQLTAHSAGTLIAIGE